MMGISMLVFTFKIDCCIWDFLSIGSLVSQDFITMPRGQLQYLIMLVDIFISQAVFTVRL